MNASVSNKEIANFVLKPQWFSNREAVFNKMKAQNINIVRASQERFSESLIDILYGENLDKEVLNSMSNYLSWKDTIIWVVVDENAHEKLHTCAWKKTRAEECDQGTIRQMFGKEVDVWGIKIIDNAIHRSKDKEQAYRDLTRMNAKIFSLNEELSNLLVDNNPFYSFRNKVDIDSNGNISKTFYDLDSFEKELLILKYLQEHHCDFIPIIKGFDNLNNIITFQFFWRKLNKTGSPSEVLQDTKVAYDLAQYLGEIHRLSSSYEIRKIDQDIITKCLEEYGLTQLDINYSWIEFIWFKHGDFSLNNILKWKNDQICIIDRENAGFWSQNLDIIKLFRSVMWNKDLVEKMIKIYNNTVWCNCLSYEILLQLFIDQAIKNLIYQEASWPKLTDWERKKYRELLNLHCKENLIELAIKQRIKHIEF